MRSVTIMLNNSYKGVAILTNIQWIETTSYEEMSEVAAQIFVEQLQNKPNSVLGFATGGTPEKFYGKLVEAYKEGRISFSEVTSFNLDEYVGIDPNNETSYYYYMNERLFQHVNIKTANIHIPTGVTQNIEVEIQAYEQAIQAAGGIDLQLLGIGVNGHIGFNEPSSPFHGRTTVVELAETTREANKRYFEKLEDVPTHAVTMGIQTIMEARKIVLLLSGASKQEAFNRLRSGEVTEDFPASALHEHPNVVVIYTDVK